MNQAKELANPAIAKQAHELWSEFLHVLEYVSVLQPGEKALPITVEHLDAMRAKAQEAKRIACAILEVLQ